MSIYDYQVEAINGEKILLKKYKGKVLLIVNTASKCGFTPQYEGLQNLYEKYHEKGLEVLGFPSNQFMNQEPGTNEEIEQFCQMNYGVSFPMFAKINVRGDKAHPLFQYLSSQAPGVVSNHIKWNFTKFLVDREGQVIKRYSPKTTPEKLEAEIESYF
ncbi:glutathione peroxidase [Gracilibacillus sp. YIM 98692]|uniref:glutathione peroxidase n=1 Tax=Gracilibacillus sp. YIM 98692 TaxID=2663532 RepID=UPI0013D5A44D|nr:glutathione peroxidase [Gracilibacillus sp. YIM 98692]